jgi:hypothetical protein
MRQKIRFRLLGFLLLLVSSSSLAQVVINTQLPNDNSIVEHSQIWNVVLIKADASVIKGYLGVRLVNKETQQIYYEAKSRLIVLSNAITQFQESFLAPIQHIVLPVNGLNTNSMMLPGNYLVCYNFYELGYQSKQLQSIAQTCEDIEVKKTASIDLIYPEHESTIMHTTQNIFTWSTPFPSLQNNMSVVYDFKLCSINAQQSAEDATKNNIPIVQKKNLALNNISDKEIFKLLKEGKYVWCVQAKNGMATTTTIAESRIFTFTMPPTNSLEVSESFSKLTLATNEQPAYFSNDVYIFYNNECIDSSITIRIKEHGVGNKEIKTIQGVAVTNGFNYIKINAGELVALERDKLYQICVLNTRNENCVLNFKLKK